MKDCKINEEENKEYEEEEDEAMLRIDAEDKRTSEKLLNKLYNSHFNFTLSSELRIEAESIRICKHLYSEKRTSLRVSGGIREKRTLLSNHYS